MYGNKVRRDRDSNQSNNDIQSRDESQDCLCHDNHNCDESLNYYDDYN